MTDTETSAIVTQRGPAIGRYADRDIPSWIACGDGAVADYVGVCGHDVNLDDISADEYVIAPGLIYRRRGSA